ncbi:helix-turn-helix domain-containing protein [Singulisphaera rosea]
MATKAKTDTRGAVKQTQHTGRWVLVGSNVTVAPSGVYVCRRSSELTMFVREAPKQRVYVSYRQSSTDDLVKEGLKLGRGTRMGNLLTLEPPRPESVPTLSGLFERVIGAIPGYTWLPREEIPTVLSGKDAAERFIGGAADTQGKTIALVRGNLSTLVVPFAYFNPSGDGTKPDFSKLAFADYGHTVALGSYEASADGILYEFDPAYRQKLKKERLAEDKSFGASLRRVRLQKGLKRSDFAPLASKTIARLERGNVERPHGKTLEAIERRLGMSADQIESY